jgi:RHS repeat-associated protein
MHQLIPTTSKPSLSAGSVDKIPCIDSGIKYKQPISSDYKSVFKRIKSNTKKPSYKRANVSKEKRAYSGIFHNDVPNTWKLLIETTINPQSEITNQKYYHWNNDTLLAVYQNDQFYFPQTDGNKNITSYKDKDGNIVAEYEYSPFGMTIKSDGSMVDEFSFRFSSEYYDKDLNLYGYMFRFYSPSLGRWMSREKLGEGESINLYGFVSNCPINYYDVLGLLKDGKAFVLMEYSKIKKSYDMMLDNVSMSKKSWSIHVKDLQLEYADKYQEMPSGHSELPGYPEFDWTKEDHGWSSPINPLSAANHFQEYLKSLRDVSKAIEDCDKDDFERKMHRLQDFNYHTKKGFVWKPWIFNVGVISPVFGLLLDPTGNFGLGHTFTSLGSKVTDKIKDPDDPKNDPDVWDDVVDETKKQLNNWYKNCKKCGDKWVKKNN